MTPAESRDQLEVEYSLNPEDGVAFVLHRADLAPSLGVRPQIPWVWVLVLVVMVGWFLLTSGKGTFDWKQTLVPTCTMFAAACMMLLMFLLFRRPWTASLTRQQLRKDQAFQAPRRLVISRDGLETTVGSHSFRSGWQGVRAIGRTPDHAFFYLSPTEAVILPRRAFANDSAFQEFVNAADQFRRSVISSRFGK
jgi:hypothetical protein